MAQLCRIYDTATMPSVGLLRAALLVHDFGWGGSAVLCFAETRCSVLFHNCKTPTPIVLEPAHASFKRDG